MLRVSSLSRSVGGDVLFRDLSFVVNPGECLGVVGPNGSGKSTLLRILAGREAPDAGSVVLPGTKELPALAQGLDNLHGTVADHFPVLFAPRVAQRKLEELAARLATAEGDEAAELAEDYDRLLSRLATTPSQLAQPSQLSDPVLESLSADSPLSALSGGEIERLALCDLFERRPPVLLLDEPTNHLDLDGVKWLEQRVHAFPGPVVVVSHDRAFLDAVATAILALDPADASHQIVAGGYTVFAREMESRRNRRWEDYRRQQREERSLKREISAIESRARGIENRTIHFYFRKRAAKVARRAVTLKSRLERDLESAERAERPAAPPMGVRARFDEAPSAASTILGAANLRLAVRDRVLVDGATFSVSRTDRVALIGPNGSGKSTLLRAILNLHPVAAGTLELAGSAVVGTIGQDDADVDFAGDPALLTPVEWIRQHVRLSPTDTANELHRFLGDHRILRTRIRDLSYGERRRLSLARLILQGANLLLLDEPTNHLDLPAREAFERVLADYRGAAIVATHDRYFIQGFATRILAINDGRLAEVNDA
jgi:ATP-binding cassette, subfamily F, member 3